MNEPKAKSATGASVVDHSCCPNANVVFEGRNIIIRSLADLHDVHGQLDLAKTVKISYIDVMEHTLVRQKKLMDQYYFLCQCDRCTGKQFTWLPKENQAMKSNHEAVNSQNLEDLMYSIRCPKCPDGSPLVVGPGSTSEELQKGIKCHKCLYEPEEALIEEYLDVKKKVEEVLNKADILIGEPESCMKYDFKLPKRSRKPFENCSTFREMTGLFHPLHVLYVKASELAFEDCIYAKKWNDAIDYGSLCLHSYKKYTIGDQARI